MVGKVHVYGLAFLALQLPMVAFGQAPLKTSPPVAPKAEQLDPKACARSDRQTTIGKGGELNTQNGKGNLSDKLARSDGVICPPERVDPEIRQRAPPGGNMPVIPPPGSPGGDPSVRPK